MKNIAWLLLLTLLGGVLQAQTSKEIFDAALVPQASVVAYADGTGLDDRPIAKSMKQMQGDFESILSTRLKSDQKKGREFWECLKNELQITDEDVAKWQFSLAFGGIQFGADPDFGQVDVLFTTELKKALTPETVKAAVLAADKKVGDGNAEDKADIVVGERNGVKLLSIIIRQTDDTAEIPDAFRRLQCAFVSDGKILIMGVEKSVFGALDRVASKTAAPKQPYIQKMFDDKEYAFLALGMFPQLKAFLSDTSAKKEDGDPAKTAALAFVTADGLSFTLKLQDKLSIALNLDLGKPEDAAMLKGMLWDGMISPMFQQFKPGIIGKIGGELPMLDSLKCVCEAKRIAISFDVSEADLKTLIKLATAKQAAPAAE